VIGHFEFHGSLDFRRQFVYHPEDTSSFVGNDLLGITDPFINMYAVKTRQIFGKNHG